MEFGLYMKHCKVEVYLMEFKLCQQSQLNETVTKMFSRGTTVGECMNVVHCIALDSRAAKQLNRDISGDTTISLCMYVYTRVCHWKDSCRKEYDQSCVLCLTSVVTPLSVSACTVGDAKG